ncbi:MAG: tandem-95 repeat protein, partial [Sphingomonadaceae bacterium]|nr:tandem-95 repeat protein [Sphingomonadaceae bacterium]
MDFKNSDIVTGPAIVDLGSADAAASLEAAATLAVAMQAGNILPLTADGQLVLPVGVGLDDIKVVGRDLVIQMPDGTQMIVPDGAVFVPQIVVDGVAVPPLNIAALLIGQEPVPEAGRPQSSGGNFADAVGDIGDPFGLGDLLPPTALAFPEPEEREIVPDLVDEEPTTIIITPDQPAGSVNATASVQEAALPARGSEPSGSNPTSTAETTTGSIVFDAPDGLGSITLNGVAVTAIGQTFVTPLGTLTITGIAPGNIGYSYTLTDNTTSPTSNDVFAVVVTDRDGDTASANLTINIVDDVPTARNDTDSVPAGNYTAQTGNVITGVGTTSGNAGADTPGADGALVSGARAGTTAGTFAGVGTTINGQYGTLTIAANGSYTYVRNPGTPGGVNDVFTYQITDGDGDTSTATLTIAIGDLPPVVTQVPTTGEGTVVFEAGLPARGNEPPGSNAPAPSESTSGTITFTPGDAPATVSINGTTITGPGQVITVPTGTLAITSYNPSGTIGYTFTLTDNTSGDSTSQTFTVTVTDADGDTDSKPFTITIVDDAPTARNDSATQGAENAPVVVNVITNDTSGADGVSLTNGVALVAGSLSGTGSVAYNGDGSFTYTPGRGEEGIVTFQYRITDGDGDTSTATVTITLAKDSVPFIEIGGDRDVAEAGLPARGSEPAGSDSASNSEIATGTIALGTGNDSIGSLVINGVNVTSGGTVTGASGTLTVTLVAGEYGYSYTLTDNTSGDATIDSFAVVLTDSDGDTATDTLVIAIADDMPTAVADTDAIAAGQYGPATGNVITDAAAGDAGDSDNGADTPGADGVVVSAVSGKDAGTVGGTTNGQYGVLTLNADGSYSYVRNAGTPGGVSDVFTYTIRDGDGDTSSATLTISIADSPTTLDLPTEGEAGTQVAEAGLPTGSNAASNSETTAGTIAFTAPDGPAKVTIDGVAVTAVGQTFTGSFGTLTITSIANGAIGYSYSLTTNTSGDATFDDFAIVVTDQDGDNTAGTLVIDIVDDAPIARADIDSVTEDDFFGEEGNPQADGNVLTGIGGFDANATDGVADTRGADGASVTGVRFGATTGSVGTGLAGVYGELVLNADGSYSYVLDNFNPAVQGLDSNDTLTEIFHYTITDGDGDARETTLTITINGSDDPITINGLNVEGPELIVDEDDLSDGSDPAPKDPLTQTGTFTVNGVDGIAAVTIEGGNVAVGQTFASAFGVFTITSVSAPVDGNATSITIGYSYTLTDNTAHGNAGGQNFLTETFDIAVTDTDGSTDSATIEVRVVDDIPTAVADTDLIAGGSNAPATGNVITDAEGDGGADTRGADGASVTAISGFGGAGNVNGTTSGQYGVLTINADGSYSYNRNNGTPGNVSDVFTYTITDLDGDTSTT